jgi:5'-3' exonuclease
MSKLNLIIDGNYILHKSVFSLYAVKSLYSDLEQLLYNEFKKLSNFYNFENVFFVTDDMVSWRKKEYADYKGKREKDKEIDWNFVYKVYDEFKERLNSLNNIKLLHVQFAEGDDLIAYIVKESNKLGFSNLIIASDGDLYQLLDYDLVNDWINIMYNNKMSDEKISLPENYKVFINNKKNSSSIKGLFDDSDGDEYIDFLINFLKKGKISEKNKEECLFLKLVSGDKGDNISSVYESMTTTGKVRGIGLDGAKSVYGLYKETYPEDINFYDDTFINRLKDVICYWKKIDIVNINTVKENVEQKIKRNLKLVVLDKYYIPEYLYGNMKNKISLV